MPPKAQKTSKTNSSRDPLKPGSQALTTRGDRRIQGGDILTKKSGTRPTTTKALILRNGKYGSQGTGEITLYENKVFGQEKLELLAEDIMKTAVRAPFNLEKLLKMADAQYDFHISQINNMRDPEFFYADMTAEVESRSPPDRRGLRTDLTNDAKVVADAVGYRVHNVYVLASSWRLVCLILRELKRLDVSDSKIQNRVKSDESVRAYLETLIEVLQNVMALGLSGVQTLATASVHFSPYFAQSKDGTLSFDTSKLKDLYKSYVDSIILELIMPQPRFPPHVLFACLRDCIKEYPKDDKRFPQAMWDAVGDLSITVQCLDMIEVPLIGLPPRDFQQSPVVNRFQRAQMLSIETLAFTEKYRGLIHPINKMKTKANLDRLWAEIDKNYKEVTGLDVDNLFELVNERTSQGQWSYKQGAGGLAAISEETKKKDKKNFMKAIAADDDDDDDMPDLLTVSDSSDLITDSDDNGSNTDGEYDDDSQYASDDEDHIRDLLREAMDQSSANPDLLDPNAPEPAEAKTNGFLRALRHLSSKMFSGDPALTTDGKPRKTFFGPPRPPRPIPSAAQKGPSVSNSSGTPAPPTSMRPTMEEVEDEDAPKKKKKKKKPKKKKKKSKAAGENGEVAEDGDHDEDGEEEEEIVPTPSSPTTAAPAPPTESPSPAKAAKPKSNATKSPPPAKSSIYGAGGNLPSTISLVSTIGGSSAQSARAYLRDANLLDDKVKSKSRPDVAPQSPSKSEPKPKKSEGIFAKVTQKIKLKEKSRMYLSKFLGTDDPLKGKGAMKWEAFVKVMTELGFTYDGATAGSSVRFDPPDPKDKSITIHKPHPDSTLQPNMIKNIGKRLRERYDWKMDQFVE